MVRCVSGSNARIDSSVSPKKSRRTGWSARREKIDDAAALRIFAGLAHGRARGEAVGLEPGGAPIRRASPHCLARRRSFSAATSFRGGTRCNRQSIVVATTRGRSNEDLAGVSREKPNHAPRDDAGVRRYAVVGLAVPGRELRRPRCRGRRSESARSERGHAVGSVAADDEQIAGRRRVGPRPPPRGPDRRRRDPSAPSGDRGRASAAGRATRRSAGDFGIAVMSPRRCRNERRLQAPEQRRVPLRGGTWRSRPSPRHSRSGLRRIRTSRSYSSDLGAVRVRARIWASAKRPMIRSALRASRGARTGTGGGACRDVEAARAISCFRSLFQRQKPGWWRARSL